MAYIIHLYLQITRISPSPDPTIYCIQYQLYGCTETPTDCVPLISYDYTIPNQEDSSYTGECNENSCSGGVGMLTDSDFGKLLINNQIFYKYSQLRLIGSLWCKDSLTRLSELYYFEVYTGRI